MKKKLKTIKEDGLIGGVCAGLSEWTGISVIMLRFIFFLGGVFGNGTFLVLYIMLWAFLPEE